MRAVRVDEFGGPEALVVTEVPDPVPGPGEVLVRVEAAGVNRADVLTRAGTYHRAGKPPLILGLEGAGTIAAVGQGVGDGVDGLRVGQKVVAMGAANAPGFYAEQAVVAENRLVVVPDSLDPFAAAALPIAWLTAWYCLRRLARLQPGETVLVHAAASGVGSAAVQIAAGAGARVIAAASTPEKAQWAADLGADELIVTGTGPVEDLPARVRDLTGGAGADVVLDTVGGPVFAQSLHAAAFLGRVISLANVTLEPSVIDTRDFYPKNVSIQGFQLTGLLEHGYDPRPDLTELVTKVAQGTYRVPVDSVFPLADAPAAHRRLESRAPRGKVMLAVK